jgi:hypothetical protein
VRLDRHIFCEGVRQEITGQLLLYGVFAGDHLISGSDDPSASIEVPLACYLVFDQMEGVVEYQQQVQVMKGTELIQSFPPETSHRPDSRERIHAHVFGLGLMSFPGVGEYSFNFLMRAGGDTLRFSRKFVVRAKRPVPTTAH